MRPGAGRERIALLDGDCASTGNNGIDGAGLWVYEIMRLWRFWTVSSDIGRDGRDMMDGENCNISMTALALAIGLMTRVPRRRNSHFLGHMGAVGLESHAYVTDRR
jgi:hypothetical protein